MLELWQKAQSVLVEEFMGLEDIREAEKYWEKLQNLVGYPTDNPCERLGFIFSKMYRLEINKKEFREALQPYTILINNYIEKKKEEMESDKKVVEEKFEQYAASSSGILGEILNLSEVRKAVAKFLLE